MARYVRYSILIGVICLCGQVVAEESCCTSNVAVFPLAMPPGQDVDVSGIISNTFLSPVYSSYAWEGCPRDIDIKNYEQAQYLDKMMDAFGKVYGVEPDPGMARMQARKHGIFADYIFIGRLTATDTESEEGRVYGQFALEMKLMDNCPSRSGQVVKQEQTSWDGSNMQIAGQGSITGRPGMAAIEALGRTFTPLDKLIYDYERVPENCKIKPEKEKVKIGEKITINLQNIVDGRGRPAKSWQRLLVKAEKGKILNGRQQSGGYHVFKVGDGSVEVRYMAPEECPEGKKDTITVDNSCDNCAETRLNFFPERQIAEKDLEIICPMEIEYNWEQRHDTEDSHSALWDKGRVPLYIEPGTNTVKGQGTIASASRGTSGECSSTFDGARDVSITGKLVTKEALYRNCMLLSTRPAYTAPRGTYVQIRLPYWSIN